MINTRPEAPVHINSQSLVLAKTTTPGSPQDAANKQ